MAYSLTRVTAGLARRHATRVTTAAYSTSTASDLNLPLAEVDPAVYSIIQQEKARQRDGIDLIPSENFTSRAVMDALGSVMQNKYSEGYPGARYYGGNQFI
ncbi:serine hydroxymethyltransferase-domain-containing protein, partial [Dimargaris cristalligena]